LVPQVTRLRQSNDFYQVENSLADPVSWLQQWQLINTTTWHATDLLTVKNIASYSVIRQNLQQDFYGSNIQGFFGPQPLVDIRAAPTSHSTDQYNITEELQLQGRSANNKLNWQFGVYYEQSTPRAVSLGRVPIYGLICSDLNNLQCFSTTAASVLGAQSAAARFRNMGIYAQGTYAILDNLKLTAGMRFTHDETKGVGSDTLYAFGGPPAASPIFALCGVFITGFACNSHQRVTSDAPTWLLDLEYSPIQDLMAYVKYSRGYRQGSVNPFAPSGFDTFLPETVEVYELGTKTTFRGRVPGTFNVAVFYNDFAQQQLDYSLVSTFGLPQTTAIVNAGTSRMYGAEIEASLRPFQNFRLDASASYLSTKILNEHSVTGTALYDQVIPTSREGGPLSYSPKYKATVTGTYTLPLPETVGTVEFAATYAFQSAYSTFAPEQSIGGVVVPVPFATVDRTNLVNLNLNWLRIFDGPVDASFFVTNLLDETYVQTASGTLPTLGFDSRVLGTPRMFGGRLKLRFGSDARS
jgi:iron complex outermembrane receptor protein